MHLLAKLSMRNRALIALVTIVIAIFGAISLTSLKQELAPSIAFPQLSIVTSYPGASPDVVDHDVSTPIETAIQGITGLESTSSTSSTGLSRVTASFTYGTDLAFADDGSLYAVQIAAGGLLAGPIGSVVKVTPGGSSHQTVAGSSSRRLRGWNCEGAWARSFCDDVRT